MGVTYLLDTHVLLWLLGEPERLPETVREDLADVRNSLLVSAASAMEVATKVRLGKLEATGLVHSWSERLADLRIGELAIESQDALLGGAMTWEHRDPFDRLIAAQALRRNVPLVSVDPAMAGLPGLRVVGW